MSIVGRIVSPFVAAKPPRPPVDTDAVRNETPLPDGIANAKARWDPATGKVTVTFYDDGKGLKRLYPDATGHERLGVIFPAGSSNPAWTALISGARANEKDNVWYSTLQTKDLGKTVHGWEQRQLSFRPPHPDNIFGGIGMTAFLEIELHQKGRPKTTVQVPIALTLEQ